MKNPTYHTVYADRVTILPSKSDSAIMFCLQSFKGLIFDRSLMYVSYPQDRINTQMIYRFVLAKVECIVVSKIDENCCKQTLGSLP